MNAALMGYQERKEGLVGEGGVREGLFYFMEASKFLVLQPLHYSLRSCAY